MAGYGVALVACLAALVHLSAAAKYTVGDSAGWTIPATSSLYSTWAAKQTFKVGDVLVFNFQSGSHTVAEVTKSAYDACATTNPITTFTTGPASINLTTAGAHYYICTILGHCSAGQKLAITATAAASPKSSPAPAPSKTPVSAPSTPPATAPAPSSVSPATAPTPTSGSPVIAPSPASTPTSGSPVTAPSPSPTPAATPASAPVPAPSSAGSSPAVSPASGTTSPASSTTPSTGASPEAGPGSGTTPSSPSSGAAAAAGPVLSILLIGATFLF